MRHAIVFLVLLCGTPLAAQETTRSPHGKLAGECADCHRPESWTAIRKDQKFDHGRTGFALEGAHTRVTCRSCHAALDFTNAPTTCASCHADLHRGELGNNCLQCHTPRSFLDRTAMVRAHSASRLPLDGAHLLADCQSCHTPAAQGRLAFVGRPTRCEGCHLATYTATRDPDHRAAGMSTDCTSCHSTLAWERARFDHAASGFPLTGAHAGLTCNDCHANFQFRGAAVTCVTCHQTDYDATLDPNHRTTGMPTDCAACHGTVTWDGARFEHDAQWFPIYSGEHRGKWRSCSECHTSPTDYAQFTCATCHTPTETVPKHREVAGFSTTPQACLTCHRRGGD
jgi:nitrate/TMAO reductase-like tetraheme cytochrome c subunit